MVLGGDEFLWLDAGLRCLDEFGKTFSTRLGSENDVNGECGIDIIFGTKPGALPARC
jgi:hypothetical protein